MAGNQAARSVLKQVKVVGICGSIRKGSFCRQALSVALNGAKATGAETNLLECHELFLCDGLPNQSVFDGNREPLIQFQEELKSSQGIIIASPEYHGSFSGVLKNAIDLCGFEQFENKIVGLVGVSGGAMGCINGLESLRTVGRALHCWVIPQQCAIPQVWKIFDQNGNIKPEFNSYQNRLEVVGKTVASYGRLHSDEHLEELMQKFITGAENFGASSQD